MKKKKSPKTYRVLIFKTQQMGQDFIVEAHNENEAHEKAVQEAREKIDWDLTEPEFEVDHIEKIK